MRKSTLTLLTSGLLAATLAPAIDTGHAKPRRAPESRATLRLMQPEDPQKLEIAETDAGGAVLRRLGVTDLRVRLQATGDEPLAAVLALSVPSPPRRGDAFLIAEIIVVAGGRLFIEERARCGAWVGDVATCRAECDGGTFALVRAEAGGIGLRLVVGRLPGNEGEGTGDGVRLGACRDGAAPVSLMPRGGKPTVDVGLVAE